MSAAVPKTTTRELRANLREILAQAAKGKGVVVTLRGKPYVRIVPVIEEEAPSRYPLRGSVRAMADDFDAPLDEAWEAAAKKPSPASGRAAKKRKKAS
jgi:prevent-host-death family protein